MRWLLGAVVALFLLAVAGLLALLLTPAPAPLTLPTLSATTTGTLAPVDGTWVAGQGSVAGYRAEEQFLGIGNEVVGRSTSVTGTVVITGGAVSSASFSVDLTAIQSGGKTQPQLTGIMDTAAYPDATFTLTKPVVPGVSPTINKNFIFEATGLLSMHGTTHLVTVAITARYTGSLLEATGSIPLLFSNWDIHSPVENNGAVEFLLMMRP